MFCLNVTAVRVGTTPTFTAQRDGGINIHACRIGDGICVRASMICGLSIGWEEFMAIDGRFLDINGDPLLGKIV